MTDLIERVARALAGPYPDEMVQAGNTIGEPCDYPRWMLFQPDARKVIPIIVEACAKVAESVGESYGEDEAGWLDCTETVAMQIRQATGGVR